MRAVAFVLTVGLTAVDGSVEVRPAVELLTRADLADGTVAARLAELMLDRQRLARRYRSAHPTMVELDRRIAALHVLLPPGAPPSPRLRDEMAAYAAVVHARLARLQIEDARLAEQYGDRHPKRLELREEIEHVDKLTRLLPTPVAVPFTRGELVVERGRVQGTLAYLAGHYRDEHPRVVAARAALAEVEAALARAPAEECAVSRATIDRAVRAGPREEPSVAEGAAVYDAIIAARAALACQ